MKGPASNVAVTLFAASMVTTQSPMVFGQSPDQPTKVESLSAVAIRVTVEYAEKPKDLTPPVLARPFGTLFTDPPPDPVMVNCSG